MQGEVTIHIDAPPERVYDLVSDITRMGEWSPECRKAEWVGGATGPAPGAKIRGHNRKGWVRWTTTSTVTDANRPRQFAFATPDTQWRYVIEPEGDGAKVTESFEEIKEHSFLWGLVVRLSVGGDRDQQLRTGMLATLQRIKAAAEQTGGSRG